MPIHFDDPRWSTLVGGYRTPYDARPALRQLAANWRDDSVWSELWNELHHQADVGDASYAAVPALVEIARGVTERGFNFYSLAAVIEIERHARDNPEIPEWLVPDYLAAWKALLPMALEELRVSRDPYAVQSAIAVVALAKGRTKLARLILDLDDSELDELLDDQLAWGENYLLDRPPRLQIE